MDPASASIVKRFLQVWTPTLMLLSPDGEVYTEWNGYLPPALFLASLLLGLGKAALKQDRFEQATALFDEVAANHPGTDAAAEALYWAAVSRYKGSHDGSDLIGGWEKLRSQYPGSVWRTKQSFAEM
jgi:hypothetical protein